MKILVTGGGGMVGRNILEHARASGHQMLAPTRTELDLFSRAAVRNYLESARPDLIVHCAGRVGGIQANIANPVGFLVDNFDMGRNLVTSAHETGIKRLINIGSSCMYPRNIAGSLSEEMVLTGELEPTNESYAIAKIAIARLCQYVRKQDSSFEYKTLIPCNLYGRFDKFDPKHSHLIPAVIHKIYEARTSGRNVVDIWGTGEARREFMDAGDLADFIFEAIERFENVPDILNVGLGTDHTINEYYKAVAKVVGYEGRFEHDLTKPVGMNRKLVSVKKLEAFGWRAKISLENGIKKAFDFYLKQKETSQ
jgi:GDP-L-fucose synthase